jgi:type I restriction enzyme S subunit
MAEFVRLGDIVEKATGTRNPTKAPDVGFIYVDVAAVDNVEKAIVGAKTLMGADAPSRARKLIRSGDVLVSTVRPNLNAVALVPNDLDGQVASIGFCVLRASEKVLPEYILFFTRSRKFVDSLCVLVAGAMYPAVTDTQVLVQQLPLPPIAEQRRIVDLLSRAEGIVSLRREAKKKAAELIPALFLDMFGDPATNPKGWPASSFGAVGVLDRGRSRNRPRDAKELYDGPYPFIQTGDVSNSGGRIQGYTATYSEAGLAQSRLWKRGTLCITIAANIAKTGVLEFDACFPDSVVGFLPSEQVRTAYVQAWLGFLQPTLEANAPQAAQKNINLEILRNLPIPLPPLALQETFEQRCSDVFSIRSQQSAATAKAQAAFDALLARCFVPPASA